MKEKKVDLGPKKKKNIKTYLDQIGQFFSPVFYFPLLIYITILFTCPSF